jgi:hypothetical protein
MAVRSFRLTRRFLSDIFKVRSMSSETKMASQSKAFFLVFFLLIAGSLAAATHRFFVVRSYAIQGHAACDPSEQVCFTAFCDPDGEECSGDVQEDATYYKIVRKRAADVAVCVPGDEACDPLACREGQKGCTETLCDPDRLGEGEVCSDPETFRRSRAADGESGTDGGGGSEQPSGTGADLRESGREPELY